MSTFHSILHSGMAIFDKPIQSTLGGVTIDLASAPIAPGDHRMTIETGIGGIEIYLPRYVTFTFDGGPAIGGHDVHEGLGVWNTLVHKLRAVLRLPNQVPDHAIANPDPTRPVTIHFIVDGGIGGIDVYRI